MANPFVHVELHTSDLQRAKEFYGKLFDWKLEDMPMPGGGSYTMIRAGEGTGGGMTVNQAPGVPPHWLAYVGVEDVRASTKKAKDLGAKIVVDVMEVGHDLGAKIVVDVMEVGEYGIMSVIADPTGATLAMWQQKTPKK